MNSLDPEIIMISISLVLFVVGALALMMLIILYALGRIDRNGYWVSEPRSHVEPPVTHTRIYDWKNE